MEARENRDPGYDDWFDEPEPPSETQSGANRGVYEDTEEVWVLPEEETARGGGHRHREISVAGRTLTTTQLAIIAASLLAIFFAILAAAGVFNGAKAVAPPVTPPTTATPPTTPASTPTNTTPTTQAPAQTLKPGDTGSQVKDLQRSLTALGFTVKVDGDYGPATQAAVEKFQASKKLAEDGVVGPQTLAALQQGLTK
jgi:Putative peptidoglycan binding domain